MEITNLKQVAEAGEKIYLEKYKSEFEVKHSGHFVAIDIDTERAFVNSQPEKALQEARQALPNGIFHLIKIGAPGAYRAGYQFTAVSNGLF